MNSVGLRLKGERKRLGYDLDSMAKAGGVGRSTQARYEADEARPNADYLNKISAVGAEIFWIMRGDAEDDALREKTQPKYSPEVREFIENYIRCSPDVQEALRMTAKASAKHQKVTVEK